MTQTARQRRLVELARRAWPGKSIEVVAPDESPGCVHVWDERGHTLLHVEHADAERVLSLLGDSVSPSTYQGVPCGPAKQLAVLHPSHVVSMLKLKPGDNKP